MPTDVRAESRRNFLRFLAESPLLCGLGGLGGSLAATAAVAQDDSVLSGSLAFNDVITSPNQALNVWDFENALRARLNPGKLSLSWDSMATACVLLLNIETSIRAPSSANSATTESTT